MIRGPVTNAPAVVLRIRALLIDAAPTLFGRAVSARIPDPRICDLVGAALPYSYAELPSQGSAGATTLIVLGTTLILGELTA